MYTYIIQVQTFLCYVQFDFKYFDENKIEKHNNNFL